ncbi:MAG: hypothetical protein EPO07_12970 [Verrucomicrobia bacterium]|nr:MAG: hypothetical protein EPO07_12970 [Verrucomicrobiota bacterium]
MSPADAVPFVLLVLFVGVFVGAVMFLLFVARWHRRELESADRPRFELTPPLPAQSQSLRSRISTTRRPRLWLAVHQPDSAGVFATLGLNYPQPCHWNDCEPGSGKMFVSVPVNGWTLIAGDGIPDPIEDIDRCYKFLVNLSIALGHVQMFVSDPIFSHHAWARLESGRVIRAYTWAGHTLWNQGALTPEERSLSLRCFAYGDEPPPFNWQARDVISENASQVSSLAAAWSIDPAELEAVPSVQTAGAAGFSGWIAS